VQAETVGVAEVSTIRLVPRENQLAEPVWKPELPRRKVVEVVEMIIITVVVLPPVGEVEVMAQPVQLEEIPLTEPEAVESGGRVTGMQD
jgi:hypothetical protein